MGTPSHQIRPVPVCVTVVNDAPGEPLELPTLREVAQRDYESGQNNHYRTDDLFHDSQNCSRSTNKVVGLYNQAFNAGAGRWLSAMAVLGLSAAIISMQPGQLLLAAASLNLASACLHIPLTGPAAKPVSPINPRPSKWYITVLLLSTVGWAIAMALIFSVYSDNTHIANMDAGTATILENLVIGCGSMGTSSLLCCLYQWRIVFRLINGDFDGNQVAEAFLRNE